MLASLVSRPAVQRFLSAPGPLVLYSALAVFFGWQAVSLGWSSAGCFVCGWLALFFLVIAINECRWCLTGRHSC